MKTTTLALILFLTGFLAGAQMLPRGNPKNPPPNPAAGAPAFPSFPSPPALNAPSTNQKTSSPGNNSAPTNSSATDASAQPEEAGIIYKWPAVDINQVLDIYSDLVGKTLLRPSVLPGGTITLETKKPLTKTEAIEVIQTLLAMNNISIINIGDKFAKVVPTPDAGGAGGSLQTTPANQLPQMGSYVTEIVQLNYVKPSEIVPIISPLAKIKDINPIDSNGILVIRDYAENVKRMLEMITNIDVSVPQEYISEVIPIKYAQAEDIAGALNSLGGQGSATVTFGQSSSPNTVSGIHSGGIGGSTMGNGTSTFGNTTSPFNNQSRTFGTQGTTTPNGTPTPGTTFQQRLMNIINKASTPGSGGNGQEQIQVFGQAKIIADQRSNSLLVFATRQDMANIKAVIAKLDVLLSQVLIESVIIDYSLPQSGNTLAYGISAAQNPQGYSSSLPAAGGGGINNGPPLLSFLNGIAGITNSTGNINTLFTGNALPSGTLSYFGNIGPHWDVALQAAASDSRATIVQRPSIMTSQAKPAQFFVGNTVPYINGTTYGGAYGNQSSYSQLSVGVELDVTPFINPEGLVVMDINQEIDALNGYTAISGVGNIPNTIKRTLSSEVAVNNRDAIMLGGFIENDKSTSRSGIPLLMDIPLLGNLFTSRSASKGREELIVMMRPTVLKTPEIAAQKTTEMQRQLPGVYAAELDDAAEQQKLIKAETRRELSNSRVRRGYESSPVSPPEAAPASTNNITPVAP